MLPARDLYAPRFLRGDSSSDRRVNISDATRCGEDLHVFAPGGDKPALRGYVCCSDDASVGVSDGIAILSGFCVSGTNIPDPSPFACGPDPSLDGLVCNSYPPCDK